MGKAKRSKKREVDKQKHPDKHVDLWRNPDTLKCKDTASNNRISQYLPVCPAAYEVFRHITLYSLEQPSEIGSIIPVLPLRTPKLSEVNNFHRATQLVHSGSAIPTPVCDWAALPWQGQRAYFLLSGKVSVGIYVLSIKVI